MPSWFPFVDLAVRAGTLCVGIVAVIIAAKGLRTWHRQLHGQFNLELARKTSVAVHTFCNELDDIRWEMEEMKLDDLRKRYREAQSKLAAGMMEAELVWGPAVMDIEEQLEEAGRSVFRFAKQLFRMDEKLRGSRRTDVEQDKWDHLDGLVYGDADDDGGVDAVTQQLEDARDRMNEIVAPHLPNDYKQKLEGLAKAREASRQKAREKGKARARLYASQFEKLREVSGGGSQPSPQE